MKAAAYIVVCSIAFLAVLYFAQQFGYGIEPRIDNPQLTQESR